MEEMLMVVEEPVIAGPIVAGPITATAETGFAADVTAADVIAELERRVGELETAIGDLRSLKASAGVGRKTLGLGSVVAKGDSVEGAAGVDDALRSLSVEQRIAVKSGLMRVGLL